ncbi:hypothetical protein [Rickettsiales endosymbiont of Trichoplax sp. H2]|uniref:hypothetical protein n=1 Tax=Rickettsiales endosymbiont of Trichoplax sp. H2 TaxID=2021221 RepID=UPI0012B3D128|nr:hypothetical protein [Rickettsiales endosymbiont of Trichoplax sp. H2]MSO14668.1 putative pterin-4-alpha-carbinolamine dehydratase [Rickettsiales endosymbiont of Trichoplax sp. H2]
MELASKKCIPCSGGITPMDKKEIDKYINNLGNGWKVNSKGHINKEYKFQESNSIEGLQLTIYSISHQYNIYFP